MSETKLSRADIERLRDLAATSRYQYLHAPTTTPDRLRQLCSLALAGLDDAERLDWMDEHGASVDVVDDDCLPCSVQSSLDSERYARVAVYDIRKCVDRARSSSPAVENEP